MEYPKYFRNKETTNVYKFIALKEGKLHIVNDGVSRFPSDFAIINLYRHDETTVWEEVNSQGGSIW